MTKSTIRREEWIKSLNVENRDEKLFELEMNLKGLDRFFSVRNLPISNTEGIVIKNFHNEMKVVSFALERSIMLLKSLLPPEDANAFNFQMYLENTLLIDYARDKFMLKNIRQSHPRESLFLILLTFINLSVLIKMILNQRHIPYIIFHHTGQVILREMAINKYFNPLETPVFTPRYDRITNSSLKKAFSKISGEKVRNLYTIIAVALFRYIKYLEYINPNESNPHTLKYYILIFSLLRSEVSSLTTFIEKEAMEKIKNISIDKEKKSEYLEGLDSICFQMDIESRKVFNQIMRDVLDENRAHRVKSIVDTSRGILRNIFEQSIVTLAQSADPEIKGNMIFPDFISRYEQSVRLREDIFVFIKLLEIVEKSLVESDNTTITRNKIIPVLNDFISYFLNLSFNYVRYADTEDFMEFFNFVSTLKEEDLKNKKKLTEFRLRIHTFKTFLETTFTLIQQRADLQNSPLDEKKAMDLLSQFV